MLRIEPGNLVIIPNELSCLMWSRAVPGREPPRKATTQAGVLSMSFWRFCSATFKYMLIISISVGVSTREERPEKSTGVEYIWCILMEVAGFP